MKPKVSVVIITYNHEKFIKQAIDSVLMQETDFNFEILIGEDDSSDKTRAIVIEYQKKHPNKIRLFLHDRKDVIYIEGRATGRWNLIDTLSHAEGEYIACLEGDDYWTDPRKLQKQVDLLDKHPEFTMCFHTVMRIYEDQSYKPRIHPPGRKKHRYILKDLLVSAPTPFCSVIFRNGLFGAFPKWYYQVPVGDWPLHILNAQYGDIAYIDEVMGVYRIHSGGIFSLLDELHKLEWGIKRLKIVQKHLNSSYNHIIQSEIELKLCRIAIIQKQRIPALKHLFLHISHSPFTALSHTRRLVSTVIKLIILHSSKNTAKT